MASHPLLVHAALLTVSVVFGANYVFTKEILGVLPPQAWIFFRIAAATAVILPLAWLLARSRIPARQYGWLCLAALLGVAVNHVLFTEGMALTTPAHSAVVNALIPTWTLLAAVVAGQERLSGSKVVAIATALTGVAILLEADQLLAHGTGVTREMLTGDLLTMANGISFAWHLVVMRRIGRALDPWASLAVMFAFATLATGLWCGPAIETAHVEAVVQPPTLWYALYGVLAACVLTYFLNTWALQRVESSRVALYINVQPIVAASLGWAMGHPAPTWRFFSALALVTTGLLLLNRAHRTD